MTGKYRLYVDEVGNSDLTSSQNPNHRFLSLTGVIFEIDYVRTTVFPVIEDLKTRYFDSHPDSPLIFHRKELVNRRHPFSSLRDPAIEESFNSELLTLLNLLDYTVITVVIDKQEHEQRCFRAAQARHERKALPQNFGGLVAAILEEQKYHRDSRGKIDGWGRKWLP